MNQFSDPVGAFERIALDQPEHPAVIDDDTVVTYGELLDDVKMRSAALTKAGLLSGGRVGLVAESSVHYLATALAVWRAGGVLVTIYPSSGTDDLQYALESSDPVLVITGAAQHAAVAAVLPNTPLTDVVDFTPKIVRADAQPNPSGLREPLTLICFSSGTTSRPKAIMLTATSVHNCAETYGEVWHLTPQDRGVVCLPMAWMYGLTSTAMALLLRGSTLIIVRRARPELLGEAMRRHRATFVAGVSSTFARLAAFAEQNGLGDETFGALRLCISGGEPRNEAAFARWTAVTGVHVLDAYCSSECLPLVTYDPTTDPEPRPGSAGKLMPRAKLRIVDEQGEDVPAGDVGEGLSWSPGIMLGYWKDPAQTDLAITEDGWYRTKDLIRIDDDGFVHVVGRLSDLIIRGGVNISPGEVERAMRQHAAVADVAVVGLHDEMYGQRVVAAVIPAKGFDLDEVSAHAAATLTAYKRPSEYVLVEEFPVTSTGKVDRRALATLIESPDPKLGQAPTSQLDRSKT